MGELLSAYRHVHSSSIEEARDGIAEVLSPHRLQPLAHRASGLTIFNVAPVGAIHVCYLTYGVPVRVRAAASSAEGYFLVTLPLAGHLVASSGRDEINADREAAAILDSEVDVDVYSEAAAELLMVRLDRGELEAQLAMLLGRSPATRLDLHGSLDTTKPAVRSWLSTVRMLCNDLDGSRGLSHAALQKPTEQLLMTQLLTAVPPRGNEDLAALSGTTSPAVAPRVIRRADQLISDHAQETLTVVDIAAAVGISVRSLQEGFRRHLDTTPTERLRHARLTGVHAELRSADPSSATVSRLAHSWGFTHLGRFARDYRRLFGESPSKTLHR